MEDRYDVVVVGLGAMGSAATGELARRGLRVVGIEQFAPGHDLGSSHGGSRMIRQSYFEDPSYVPLVLAAYERWRRLERDSGEELLVLGGGLYLGSRDCRTVTGALESAKRWSLPHELLDAAEIRRHFPAFAPSDHEVGLFEAEAGFVRPERAILAQVRLAARAGAELRTGVRVIGWEPTGDGVRVLTTAGSLRARHLAVTAGGWAPRLLAGLRPPLVVERQVQYWFRPVGSAPVGVGELPCWIWDRGGSQVYGFPAVDGAAPKVGLFRLGTPTTADDVDRVVLPAEVERMRRALADTVPALAAGGLEKAATCLYTTSPDEHFVIGVHPDHAQVVLATGFSGHGFKFAPVVGEILADLVVDGSTRHDLALFAPGRTAPATSSGRPGARQQRPPSARPA